MDKGLEKLQLITPTKEQKAAARSRAMGLLFVLLAFAALIYIATFARFGA